MIASSNVSINVIAKNYEFFDDEKANWNLRRNFLYLFDNMKNEVIKLDVSMGVSLLERKEQERLTQKMESIHPNIPGAKLGSIDQSTLNIQTYGDQKVQSTSFPQKQNIHVHHQSAVENSDPNLLISQNKQKLQPLRSSPQTKTLSPPKQTQVIKHQKHDSQQSLIEEIETGQQEIDEEDNKLLQKLEQEHRFAINSKKAQNSFIKMLDQPYQPPPMFYEKKQVLPPEKVIIMKETAKGKLKGPQIQIVKEALNNQEERFKQELEQREKLINQQKQMILQQNQQLQEIKINAKLIEEKKADKDFIQLSELQKLKEMDPKDKINVLEFLIRELVAVKEIEREERPRRRRHEDSVDQSQEESKLRSSQRKSATFRASSKKDSTPKVKPKVKGILPEEGATDLERAEDISIDDNNQIVESSRKEWEEDLTSTQNLKSSHAQKQFAKFHSFEPMAKLNNFMVNNVNDPQPSVRTEDENANYEDEEFESMSKSQALSASKISTKKPNNQKFIESSDYDNEKFESMADSKSLSRSGITSEGTVTCFLCKQQIPKSQSKNHVNQCKKMTNSKKDTDEQRRSQIYSPIKEIEDEGKGSQSEDSYSQQFEESSVMQSKRQGSAQRKYQDKMRDSYMSSSLSTEKPTGYQKKADVLKSSADNDDFSASASESLDKGGSPGGDMQGLMDRYKQYKALIAKYQGGEYEDSGSLSISKP